MTAAPASDLDRFLEAELAKDAPPAPATAHDGPPPPQPLMTFRRAVPPVDTVAIGDEIHVLKAWPTLATGMQTAVINDRNAQLALRTRMEAGETLSDDEIALHDFYLHRMLRVAVPTLPAWALLPVEEGGMLLADREVLVNLFFVRSNEVSALLNQSSPSTSGGSSPGSSASTAATRAAGSGSAGTGSKSTRRNSGG